MVTPDVIEMRHSPASPEAGGGRSRPPSMRKPGSPVASCWSGCCWPRWAVSARRLRSPSCRSDRLPAGAVLDGVEQRQACSSGSTASRCSRTISRSMRIATVFPEGAVGSADSQTLLIHVPPEVLHLPPEHAELGARRLRRVLEGLYARRLPGRAVSGERADAHLPVPPVDVRRPRRRDADVRAGRPAAAAAARSRSSPTGRSSPPATSPTRSARASGISRRDRSPTARRTGQRRTTPRTAVRADARRPSSTASSPGSTSGPGSRP